MVALVLALMTQGLDVCAMLAVVTLSRDVNDNRLTTQLDNQEGGEDQGESDF